MSSEPDPLPDDLEPDDQRALDEAYGVSFEPGVVDEPPGDVDDSELFTAGEKATSTIAAGLELIARAKPAGPWGAAQLFGVRMLIRQVGGLEGVMRYLPAAEDADGWDSLLSLLAGIALELRADDAAPVDLEVVQAFGADSIRGLMLSAEAS